MPYHLLQTVLGAAFLAVWAFIAMTMLRDKLNEARRKRLTSLREGTTPAPQFSKRRRRKRKRDQAVAGA